MGGKEIEYRISNKECRISKVGIAELYLNKELKMIEYHISTFDIQHSIFDILFFILMRDSESRSPFMLVLRWPAAASIS